MKILVTGATGFVGTHLLRELFRRGHEIVVADRDPERARGRAEMPVVAVAFPKDVRALEASLKNQKIDAVVHLAGEPIAGKRWSAEQKKKILESRSKSTRLFWDWAKRAGVGTWVQASAVGYYGDRGDEVLTEASAPGRGFLPDVCLAWEAPMREAGEGKAPRACAFRFGVVLGRDARGPAGALTKLVPLFRAGVGGPIGSGKQWMAWIHVNDLTRLLVDALENPSRQGVYNAVSPNPQRNEDFSRALGRALGRPSLFKTPALAVKVALGEMACIVLDSTRVLPKRLLDGGFSFEHSDLEGALREILDSERAGEGRLTRYQAIRGTAKNLFTFFGDAKNLERLTPDTVHFKILSGADAPVQEGSEITYRIQVHGVPMNWKTRIVKWDPPHRFVDVQEKGPYAKWEHEHALEELPNGYVFMRDDVRYRLPLGAVGTAVGGAFVRGDVEKIFDFRRKKIAEEFKC